MTKAFQKRFALLLQPLVLAVLSLSCGGAADVQPEPARALTFIEVRRDAVDRGKAILQQYETALRQAASSPHVEVLQELGRPERFVLIETARRTDELAGVEAGAQQILTPLNDLLTAPLDRRAHREFGDVSAGTKTDSAAKSAPGDIYVIAHLDLGSDQARGQAALNQLTGAARDSPGNLRFEVWQQSSRPNHFNIVARWSSRGPLDEFTASAAAREFRASVAPLIGSLFDDRHYRRID
jgi:quinol monooxygenase YgiN